MVSEQGEAIGGYPQHLPSHLPCLPQAGLGGPASGFDPRVLRAAAPGRGGHGLAGLTGRQWGLGRFRQSEPLLAALLALPLGSAQTLRKASPGMPRGVGPFSCSREHPGYLPLTLCLPPRSMCGGPGRVGRAVLALQWPCSCQARAPAPPAQPCSPCGRKALLLPPPCLGARVALGHSPRPSGARRRPVPRATWLAGSSRLGPRAPTPRSSPFSG